MAICLVLFNPVNSKRMLMNYHYIVHEFKLQNFPIFTLELIYTDRKPQIVDAIHVKSNSIMFHKENMCRVLEKHIPSKFTKLAFLDADIVFKDKEWYSKVSNLLESYDVVQPFETCHWLDLTYKKIQKSKQTVLLMKKSIMDWDYHPGFAWCFRREWYNKFGFFDTAIGNGGDTYSAAAWLKLEYTKGFTISKNEVVTFKEFYDNMKSPKLTYLEKSDIYHLYHGSLKNRNYCFRSAIFKDDIGDGLTYTNSYGIYEWKDPEKWNPLFLKYFDERNDDDISCTCDND